jgi:uncharacterized coiled-coil DUF342 family protein
MADKALGALIEENKENIKSLRELIGAAEKEKELRDKENEQIAQLKKQREELQKTVNELRQDLSGREAVLEKKEAETGEIPVRQLKRTIDEMDWRLQTEATNPRIEKALSKELQKLEKIYARAIAVEPIKKEVMELRKQVHSLTTELRACHESILVHAKESDVHHAAAVEHFKTAGKLRERIYSAFEKIDAARKIEKEEKKEIDSRKELLEQKREFAEAKITAELKEKAKKILEEFKNGKTITVEELQILQNTEP